MAGTFLSTVVFLAVSLMALARIGWGYCVAFASANGSEFGCHALLFPEVELQSIIVLAPLMIGKTNGLTLEEINSKFGDAVAMHFQENEVDSDTASGDQKLDVDF